MTEIALALAMGFFSIMVLSMVSLGAVEGSSTDSKAPERTTAAAFAPAAKPAETQGAREVHKKDAFFVYYDGRLYNRDLEPVSKSARRVAQSRRAVLALPPELSVEAAMTARQKIKAENLIVAPLSKAWMDQLKEMQP